MSAIELLSVLTRVVKEMRACRDSSLEQTDSAAEEVEEEVVVVVVTCSGFDRRL